MVQKSPLYKPVVLVILDGWGQSPGWSGNCISSARPRHFDYYWRNFPHLILQAFSKIATKSGIVPDPGIGHTILGAGRIIYPNSTRISHQIRSGEFFENPQLNKITDYSFKSGSNIHLIGLISKSGLMAEIEHLEALLVFFKNKGIKNVYIHGILDGKDTKPTSGIAEIDRLEQRIAQLNCGMIATLVGRSWVFDNESNWSKLDNTINALISTKSITASSSIEAVKRAYQKRISDYSFVPTTIISQDPSKTRIKSQDSIIFFNFTGKKLANFISKISSHCKQLYSLTDYKNPKTQPIFPDIAIQNSLSEVLAAAGSKQLKATESYKEKQVGFYFNGMTDKKFPKESRLIIKSERSLSPENYPQLKLYDLTEKVVSKITNDNFDFILINLVNVDIIARTGNILACEKAISYIDEALATIVVQVLRKAGCVLICSGYGNAENMEKPTHTLNPVPFIMINLDNKIERPHEVLHTVDKGSLISEIVKSEFTTADVAPTVLELLGLDKPVQMTGKSLLSILSSPKTVSSP